MPAFRLRLSVPVKISPADSATTFFWSADGACSFHSTYGPRLGGLGPVPDANVDFVRIAAAVFAADRTTHRRGGGSNWGQREFEIAVPVSDPDRWNSVTEELASLLSFLTGDVWSFAFGRGRAAREKVVRYRPGAKRVVLLSGGADSATGALTSRSLLAKDESHVLVSHVGATNLAPIQREVAHRVGQLIPGPDQRHVQISFRRRREQPDGFRFQNEPSSRSRSILFLAFGLAIASLERVPLWIPENGFASLNPPLGPERRGSLSTRTTHPAFLEGVQEILRLVDAHSEIENPFASMTKGEMFSAVAKLIGIDAASEFLSATHSCGLTGQRAFGIPIASQCGVCFGCVLRRASFVAAKVKDRTAYVAPTSTRVRRWLERVSVEQAVRDFLRRGIRSRDIIALSLPSNYPTSQALDICQRASSELRELFP